MSEKPATLRLRLQELLAFIYPEHDSAALTEQALDAFWPDGTYCRARARKPGNKLWSQRDALLITYGDSIIDGVYKPLDLLHDFLTENLKGVVNGVHILPFFPFTSDDGFAVSDYRKVNPRLGDWEDITRIGERFYLMSDLVLNHVSSQGTWFNAYRRGEEPYDRFFVEADPNDDFTAVVRPRTTPLLRKVETAGGEKHVWCTFSHDQVDLDFRNPEVLLEMLRIIRLHVSRGVRILRLDAVAFLWKIPGTNCIHLDQTHAIVKLLRLMADFSAETILLLTETNVPRTENLSYFGKRDEAHSVYNFSLPPLILNAMLSGSARELSRWQRSMPPAPYGCAYLNFTASHDGIGMRPAEGILDETEVQRMIETMSRSGARVSMRALGGGKESVYEINSSFFSAVARTYAGDEDTHFERFICSQTIVMSLEGIPAFYIHSMLATPNDVDAVERRGMNRAINRHRWDYPELRERLADPASDQSRVLKTMQERLRLRARQPAFHPNATQFTLRVDERVFALWRQDLERAQSIFAVHNVSAETVVIDRSELNLIEEEDWYDLISGETVPHDCHEIELAPYQCRWITNRS
ncbi:alpha-amylase family glycosyl hydrolase [Tepidamorphus sp. 3E244]|uniref:alpha-amylase family glycosyl hydrolase n=1 Tax=Tepidamorphus sp. 3E244 TaxID=3385498 RepID=UPI0038FD1460